MLFLIPGDNVISWGLSWIKSFEDQTCGFTFFVSITNGWKVVEQWCIPMGIVHFTILVPLSVFEIVLLLLHGSGWMLNSYFLCDLFVTILLDYRTFVSILVLPKCIGNVKKKRKKKYKIDVRVYIQIPEFLTSWALIFSPTKNSAVEWLFTKISSNNVGWWLQQQHIPTINTLNCYK